MVSRALWPLLSLVAAGASVVLISTAASLALKGPAVQVFNVRVASALYLCDPLRLSDTDIGGLGNRGIHLLRQRLHRKLVPVILQYPFQNEVSSYEHMASHPLAKLAV